MHARVQESKVRTQISKRQGEATLSAVDRWLRVFPGSPAVVQPADLRHCHDRPHFRRLNRSWLRRVLPQRKMRSRSMIVVEIRIERSSQRAFMEHDHMIQALATNGSNHSLETRQKH